MEAWIALQQRLHRNRDHMEPCIARKHRSHDSRSCIVGSQRGMECIFRPKYLERACLQVAGALYFEEGAQNLLSLKRTERNMYWGQV
jgi:hypothetical protein